MLECICQEKEIYIMNKNDKKALYLKNPLGDNSMARYLWPSYLDTRESIYNMLDAEHCEQNLISEVNWADRKKCTGSREFGIPVKVGDICYIDYGQAYLNEIGYQHFGLIVSMTEGKMFVVPMTSNTVQYAKAYDPVSNPTGRKHLMRLGQIGDMNKPSVLFLNDVKYLNTSRVIRKVAHMDTRRELFWSIRIRVLETIFNKEAEMFEVVHTA